MAGDGSRRVHSKSRNGCSQCKKRRKKCDERMPRCSNCQRWNLVCDFTALSAGIQIAANKIRLQYQPPSTQSYPKSLSRQPSPWDHRSLPYPSPSANMDFQDLVLMHQYCARTALILSRMEDRPLWQTLIPIEAKTHTYLMHAMLALSALHLSQLQPQARSTHMRTAGRHHEKALSSFRGSVNVVDAQDADAIAAFSFLVVAFSSGLSAVEDFEHTDDPITEFLGILAALRLAWVAIDPVLSTIRQGKLKKLVAHRARSEENCPMHVRGEIILNDLEQSLNEIFGQTDPKYAVYKGALLQLKVFMSNIPDIPPMWNVTLSWPAMLSQGFFELLRQKDKFALILLAHWCIVLYVAPNAWFSVWAKRVAQAIWNELDDCWRGDMVWAAELCGLLDGVVTMTGHRDKQGDDHVGVGTDRDIVAVRRQHSLIVLCRDNCEVRTSWQSNMYDESGVVIEKEEGSESSGPLFPPKG